MFFFFCRGTRFGPMEGELLTEGQSLGRGGDRTHVWKIAEEGGDRTKLFYLDCTDRRRSNWMRFVLPAFVDSQQNVVAYQVMNND